MEVPVPEIKPKEQSDVDKVAEYLFNNFYYFIHFQYLFVLVYIVLTVEINEIILCEQQYLAAGSPRMRTCFKLILADPHQIEQRNDIVKYLLLLIYFNS